MKFLVLPLVLILAACSHHPEHKQPRELVDIEIMEFPLEIVEKIQVFHGPEMKHDMYLLYSLKESGAKYCQKGYSDRAVAVDLEYCMELKRHYMQRVHHIEESTL